MNIQSLVPAIQWLPNYKKDYLRGDLAAGITVGVMLIPQGMAYAMIAGLPPIYGLYASIVPLIAYALFGTSRHLAVGPVAIVSLLVAAGVSTLAEGGSEAYIQLTILLALMVGVIQLLMGLFRLGFLVNFLSHPVISGFTSAAALIIGFSQLKHLLGIDIQRSHHIHEIIADAAVNIERVNMPTLLIGLIGIVLILVVKRINRSIPGPLLAVVFGILGVWLLNLSVVGVQIVGEVPTGLPATTSPSMNMNDLQQLLPIALTISFIGFMESIAVAKAVQAKHRDYHILPNKELIALGLANIAGSFFKAFPTTGGFSRTAVNDQSGAKTAMASIISAVLIALTLLFLTPLFYFLPKAILASVIMVAVFGLVDIKEAIYLWRADRLDFWMLLATFVGTLTLGIEEGILIGVVLSLALVVYKTTKPHIAVLGRIPNSSFYKNIDRFKGLEVRDDVLIMRFDARLYFANINYFKDQIYQKIEEKGKKLQAFILDADSINDIDSSGIHGLEEVYEYCLSRKILLYIVGAKGPMRDALHRSGTVEKFGKEHFMLRVEDALEIFDNKKRDYLTKYSLQTNATH